MGEEWVYEEERVASDEIGGHHEPDVIETIDTFEVNSAIISDTLHRLRQKAEHSHKSNRHLTDPLDELESSAKRFVVDNIRYIDYRDLAQLIGIRPERLKSAMGAMGIKVPVTGARRWKDIDLGTFTSPEACAKCRVQSHHASFFVDIMECRRCHEENIKFWIEEGEPINISFK